MREIKFRAWWKEAKVMAPVIRWTEDTIHMLIELQPNSLGQKYEQQELDDPDYILMQYTGLKDKNGRDIYEGDIVHITPDAGHRAGDWERWSTNERKPIVWDGGAFRFDGMNLYEMMGWGGYPAHLQYEVIGNIYQSPELLKHE